MEQKIEFRVLGPLEVRADGTAVVIGAAKQRALLASLLLRANAVVTFNRLVTDVWGDRPPRHPRAALHTYVMRLRKSLDAAAPIKAAEDGYLAVVDPDRLDLIRFRALVRRAEQARAAADTESESELLHEAVALWSGTCLADIQSDSLRNLAARLDEQRLVVLERRIDVDLELGRAEDVVSELTALTAQHPIREHLWKQLMLALFRCGRSAEALTAYQLATDRLRAELDAQPGPALRDLHQAILRDDHTLRIEPRGPDKQSVLVPAQLPAMIGDFFGRGELLDTATAGLLAQRTRPAEPVLVLSGPPGVGKTALAVRAAHSVRAEFPEGQLYANLRGYATESALTAGQVLPRFLRALGAEADRVPAGPADQFALYQRLLAGRRLLVLLDNVAHAEQLRFLLVNQPGIATVVTSRGLLPGTIGNRPTRHVQLGPLSRADSVQLLRSIVGEDRVAQEPEASAELAALCGDLPLALRIAAANAQSRTGLRLSDCVSMLRHGNRLTELAIDGDADAAVRSAFDLSYRALEPGDQRVFRSLALIPGADFTSQVVANLLDLAPDAARERLRALAGASLVQVDSSDRFSLHDLVRLYAKELAEGEDRAEARAAARRRLYDYYRLSAWTAARLLNPELSADDLGAVSVASEETFTGQADAAQWLNDEYGNLVSVVQSASRAGDNLVCWSVARALRGYFYFYHRRAEWVDVTQRALASVRGSGDDRLTAAVLDSAGVAYWALGEHEKAQQYYREALDLLDDATENHEVLAEVLLHLGIVRTETGDLAGARDCFAQVLGLSGAVNGGQGEARALLNLSTPVIYLGDLEAGAAYLRRAVDLCVASGARFGEAVCRNNLGYVYRMQGKYNRALEECDSSAGVWAELDLRNSDQLELKAELLLILGKTTEAVESARNAWEVAQDSGDLRAQADALTSLSRCLGRAGDPVSALEYCADALRVATLAGYVVAEIDALLIRSTLPWAPNRTAERRELLGRALDLANASGFRLQEGDASTLMARVHLDAGAVEPAVEFAERALRILQGTGYQLGCGHAHAVLGEAALLAGDPAGARASWTEALAIFTDLGVDEARWVRGLLASLH